MRSGVSMLTLDKETPVAKIWTETKATPKSGLHPKKGCLVFWDVKYIIYWELLPEKATLNHQQRLV